jgi:hypothetical protein
LPVFSFYIPIHVSIHRSYPSYSILFFSFLPFPILCFPFFPI